MNKEITSPVPIDKQIQHNEISANRLVCWVMIGSAALLLEYLATSLMGITYLGNGYASIITYIAFTMLLATGIYGLISANKTFRPSTKWILFITYLINQNLLFFIFGRDVGFFVMLPILISTRYFDEKLSLKITILDYLLYLLVCLGNVWLEDISQSVYVQHHIEGDLVWETMHDALFYEIIPHSCEFLLIGFLTFSIVRNGHNIFRRHMIFKSRIDTLNTELRIGSEIQQNILPKASFSTMHGCLHLHALMSPAKEVAGDFYDYFMVDRDHLVVLVADVSDKGLPAAMFMMTAKSELRSAVYAGKNLQEAIIIANRRLVLNNQVGMFVTLWIGSFNIHNGECLYVNAGHPFPLVKRNDGRVETIENTPNTFLGVFDNFSVDIHSCRLHYGDTLLLFTDGITDCANNDGSHYGTERLIHLLQTSSFDDANQICSSIINSCTSFAGGASQFDDMTLLALQVNCQEQDHNITKMPAKVASIPVIIDTVNSLLVGQHCPEDTRRAIDTVLDEICTNVVDYAYSDTPETDNELTVECYIFNQKIYLRVSDSGIPFNPLEVSTPNLSDMTRIGGLGIHITRNLMDEVSYRYRGGMNHLELVKYLSSATQS